MQITREAIVKFKPTPPHLSEASMMTLVGSLLNSAIALSRLSCDISPVYLTKSQRSPRHTRARIRTMGMKVV